MDFRQDGAERFAARTGTTHNASVSMEIRLDGVDGPLLGTVKIPRAGGIIAGNWLRQKFLK